MSKNTLIIEGTYFIQETLARLNGDSDTVIASRNARMAISALKGQLASLEGKKVKAENSVESAKMNFHNAQFPLTEINDFDSYISELRRTKEALTSREEDLTQIEESITFYSNLLDQFMKPVKTAK